ncbi:SdrD B-like domain-containing protein [Nocardia sp. N13]|uniref:SdrD B-like domain-containing protein n=1 Tax=Nocardioides sp. N13(2025) TaxID=3453405 RepID=UPI003F77229C
MNRHVAVPLRFRSDLVRIVVLAYGVGVVLHLVHAHAEERHALPPVLHWLRDSTLAVPVAAAAVLLGGLVARRAALWVSGSVPGSERPDPGADAAGALFGVLVTAGLYAGLSIPGNMVHGWLFVDRAHVHGGATGMAHLAADGALVLGAAAVVLFLELALTMLDAWTRQQAAALAVVLPVVGASFVGPLLAVVPAEAAPLTAGCAADTADRRYDVAAISVPIPYNRFGDVDPNGMVYVFEQDRAAVKNWHVPLAADASADPAGNRRLRPRPIVVRANEGECVEVTFTNRLDERALQGGAVVEPRASMHVDAAATSAELAGAHVGFTGDSTVGRGQTVTYYWRAPAREGLYLIRDMGMSAGGEADGGSVAHGLWGGFAVEPAGSVWLDSHSGLPLYPTSSVARMSGELYLDADIVLPSGKSFRETVQISQDEIPGVGFGFNYGADAQGNRDQQLCPDCIGEETSLSSWTYGDPAAVKLASGMPATGWSVGESVEPEDCQADDGVARPAMLMPAGVPGSCWTSNVSHAYKGDPTKIRFAHAGVKETHVFHMHAHQWLAEPHDVGTAGTNPTRPSDQSRAESTTIDSQTYGPGDAFTADLLFGAGSKPGTIGDSIFHCHLYPHFADGFWSLFRVHDVRETGRLTTPDGVRTRQLMLLPDRTAAGVAPTTYDARTNPGYPRFIPGQFGWRAPQPPDTVSAPDGSPATRIVAGQGLTPSLLNQVQDITTTGGGPDGSFTLGYRGEQTSQLASHATPTEIETALEALDGVDDVSVAARGDTGGSWRVQFLAPARNVRPLSSPQTEVGIETVAGAWQRALEAEQAAQANAFAGTGNQPRPGAPFADPCPGTARQVTYDVAVLQRDLVYNDDGWHDTQGRILVLRKDVDAIVAGTKKPEPLFFRVNAGDCINFNLTNLLPNWYGNDAFQVLQQTNMFGQHIHLVKFDVLASDGSSNGWNYQQAAFTQRQSRFNDAVLDGTRSCTANERTGACRMPLPDPAEYNPSAQGIFPGQTIHERWYADYELRTVFTHDHHFPAVDQGRGLFGGLIVEPAGMDFRNSRTGAYHQPVNDPQHGQPCGTACTGDAAGTMFDVIGPGAKDDFREFGLAFQDFVPLTRAGGNPQNPDDVFNPPAAPETFADDDPGVMGINYRNEPFLIRDTVNGNPSDPAHVFSSTVHGDPATPLLQAYAGDPVRIRLVGGSQEEQHVFGLHGMRWRDEPDDPASQFSSSRALGVSDAFNFEIPEMDCGPTEDCRGDYLYSSTATDDMYLGMWGLMRVYGKGTQGLVPLPDNQPQAANGNVSATVTGAPPPKANKPGNVCPTGAPVRSLTVAATDARIRYNRQGDHDPYGLVYVAVERGETLEEAVARARANPEPMTLRANEGDCIEVRLHNRIDPAGAFATTHARRGAADGDPRLPLEPPTGTRAGLRVSLHAQLLTYDVRGSDGATVGFNRDQTVAPGEDILYRWYAPDVTPGELGTVNLTDYGDVRGHRHHGLAAALTVEPHGSTYHDPFTGQEIVSGASADIRTPGRPDFREFTAHFQDGLNLRDATGAQVPDGFSHPPAPGELPEQLDSEDQGEKGYNYASTPYRHRLGITPMAADATSPMVGTDLAAVLSSTRYGDPDTPVFRAYAGDPVRIRLVQGGDKPRQHNFTVHGHSWLTDPHDPRSNLVGSTGGLSVDRAVNIHLDSAGNGRRGDWLYGDTVGFHHLSGGTWGLLRTYAPPPADPLFAPDPLASGGQTDDPARDGYRPLLPLELSRITVDVFDDTDMNGVRGADERRGPDVRVTVRADDGRTLTKPVRADGTATFWVGRGAFDVSTDLPADWRRTTGATVRADVSADGASEKVAMGLVQLADVGVRLYNDEDGSASAGAGEGPLSGWTVTLSRGTDKLTATTDAQGLALLDGLVPGEWSVSATPQAGWAPTRALPMKVAVAENQARTPENDTMLGFTTPAGLSVKVFNDADNDGVQDPGESSKAGLRVTARGGPPERQVTVTATTGADGVARFEDPDPLIDGLTPGAWKVSVATSGDWSLGTGSARTLTGTTEAPTPGFTCAADGCSTVLLEHTAQVVTMPVRNPSSWLVATPFNDVNNDGVRQDKETRLSGWSVTAISSTGQTVSLDTGNDGRATFYPLRPGSWTLEMISPERSTDANVLDWTSTNRTGCAAYGDGQRICTVRVDVIAGEVGTGSFGFVQLGTIGVQVFHDYDKDGVKDDNEPAQANRTVKLYDATGKSVLQTKVSDTYGWVSFKSAAGEKYQAQVVLPTGWVQTAPLDRQGRPIAKLPVTGPSGTTSTMEVFGQYNTVDSVAPPAPTSSVPPGRYDRAQTVTLTSETGATIRYTLSGTMPTATTGNRYAGPITVSSPRKLRAVAIDAAGNVSDELATVSAGSTLPGAQIDVVVPGTTTATVGAGAWSVVTGGTPTPPAGMNLAGALRYDDSQRLLLPSAYVSKTKRHVVEGVATVSLAPAQRNLVTLGVEVDGRANLTGSMRSLALYDVAAGTWVTMLSDVEQPITDLRSVWDAPGDPRRFVDSSGQVKIRFTSTRSASFDVRLDQVQLLLAHQ